MEMPSDYASDIAYKCTLLVIMENIIF